MRYLVVPGIDDSGPEHWQSRWQRDWGAAAVRIGPASFTEPELADWLSALDRAAAGADELVVVAHSLGCLAAATWLAEGGGRAAAAFLVAPPDPAGPAFPATAGSFVDAGRPIGVPALVVASTDDPYSDAAVSRARAASWGAAYVELGPRRHLSDGVVGWPEGRHLLTALTAGREGSATSRTGPARP